MPPASSLPPRRRLTPVDVFTVGRFTCRWSPSGRKVVVEDPITHTTIEAKPAELVELGEAVAAAVAARNLRSKRAR